MKRCLLFVSILLLSLLGGGCDAPAPVDCVHAFLSYIDAGAYLDAYELLHSSVRYDEAQRLLDEEAGSTQSAKRISKEQFVERYTNIFKALEITGLAYEIKSSVEGEAICVYDYALRYESGLGDLGLQTHRITLIKEDGRFVIEWAPSLIFPEMEQTDTVRVAGTTAARGEILADGVAYAQETNAISVFAVPEKIEDVEQFTRQAALLLDMSAAAVSKALTSTHSLILLKQYYPDAYTTALEEQLLDVPGITIDKSNFGTLRDNPQGSTLAHIIGYTGAANEDDLLRLTGSKEGDETYDLYSVVGKTGLERQYETVLNGEDGYYIYICTATGENRKVLYRKPAQNGLDVVLTVDPDMQAYAETIFKYTLYGEDTSGAAVVLDPTTGRIDTMVSYPSYDLNLFTRRISTKEYEALTSKKNTPLLNRLTQGRYAPGSIFKPFTAAAALASGAMTTSTAFPLGTEKIEEDVYWRPSDTGEFGPWKYARIKRVELRNRHSPPLNMHSGMVDSDNIYFAYAALRTGVEAFTGYMDALGFNEAIDFDLPLLSSQMARENADWTPMLLAESAYGQGQVLMTPLQAAAMFGAFANNGTIMRPYVVEGLYRTEGTAYVAQEQTEPAVWKQSAIDASLVNTIVPMLEDVVNSGTGRSLDMKNEGIAGKTGTAEVSDNREICWFVGFRVNSESPRLVLVMLDLPANSELAVARFDIAKQLLTFE